MRKTRHALNGVLFATAVAGFGAVATPALAETTARDVEVAARAVAFLASKPTGEQPTAIVYDPASPESQADADALNGILSGGVNAGKVTLAAPKMVAVGDLAGLDGMTVAFVAKGTAAHHAAIAGAAASARVLTMSADLDCVRAAKCVVGVQGQPSVEIYISSEASTASGQAFSSAFLMMAKEI